MNDLNPDRYLERAADEHLEREATPECAYCGKPNPRRFKKTLICKSCADDAGRMCSECGCLEFYCPDDGPAMCEDCRACETDVSIDWDEGEVVDA